MAPVQVSRQSPGVLLLLLRVYLERVERSEVAGVLWFGNLNSSVGEKSNSMERPFFGKNPGIAAHNYFASSCFFAFKIVFCLVTLCRALVLPCKCLR